MSQNNIWYLQQAFTIDDYMENLLYGDPFLPFPFLGLDESLLIPNLDET